VSHVLAVDIGGSKLAVALVDGEGRVVRAQRAPTPRGPRAGADAVWDALDGLVTTLVDEGRDGDSEISGVGMGCGGPMLWPTGDVSPLNIPAWRDFPLRTRMAERFPGVPVRLHNDAVCLAVGEHWRGSGRGRRDMLGMVVSTGVGGGLILGGRLLDGADGNAGHIGHVIVDPDGPVCACGGYGCLEAVAAGPMLVAWAQGQGWRPSSSARHSVTARELADDARRGHPVALAAMRRAGEALGIAIASATHLLNLEVVSIGGGLSQAGPLLFAPLEDSLRRHARLSFAQGVQVVPAALGLDSGLVGASALVLAGDTYWNPLEPSVASREQGGQLG
jgi:glucokinase